MSQTLGTLRVPKGSRHSGELLTILIKAALEVLSGAMFSEKHLNPSAGNAVILRFGRGIASRQ